MAAKSKEDKFSPSSLRVIERTEADFSPQVIKLGNDLLNATKPRSRGESVFTRSHFTAALAHDEKVIESMRLYAVSKGWITEFDHYSIPRVLEWVKLMRTVSSGSR